MHTKTALWGGFRVLNGIQLNLAVLSGQVSAHQRLITGDDGGGQRIFDLLFDQAAQIAGAVLDRVRFLGEHGCLT